jgi:GNAT superfamily N-acetyltransferase
MTGAPEPHPPSVAGGLAIESLTQPDAILAAVPVLARLRIGVFREFPYLYDGSLDYEREYLAGYASTGGAIVVTARDPADGNRVVGAATGMPLAAEHDELLAAFRAADMPVERFYYCAESVLEPAYRGRGAGHAFFDHREAWGRTLGFSQSCFLAVDRPADHPRRPADYRPHDAFWQKRGYRPVTGFKAHFSWRDLDETGQSPKPMTLWRRTL